MTYEKYLEYRDDFIKQWEEDHDELLKYSFFKNMRRPRNFPLFIFLFSNDIRKCDYRNVVSSLSDKKYLVSRTGQSFGDAVRINDKTSFFEKYPYVFDQCKEYYNKIIRSAPNK